MSKNIIIDSIEEKLPNLSGKLELKKVLFSKGANKAVFKFESPILVAEAEFLRIEKIIQDIYPNIHVAIRIASPALKDDFLRDIGSYQDVLERFLMRSNNATRAWLKNTAWELINNKIVLTCPDEYAVSFYKSQDFESKISQAVYDIFTIKLPVELMVAGEREEWLKKMHELRGIDNLDAELEKANAEVAAEQSSKEPEAVKPQKPKREKKEYVPGQTILYGSKIDGVVSPINLCTNETGIVNISGTVSNPSVISKNSVILTFTLSDEKGSVYCKCFFNPRRNNKNPDGSFNIEQAKKNSKEALENTANSIKAGTRLLINGNCTYDSFLNDTCVIVRSMAQLPVELVEDNAPVKRVELNCHTQMSALAATNSAKDMIEYAAQLGHKAIAITDYGVVQAYPEAFATAKKQNIKLIPGCELYMCDWEAPISNPDNRDASNSIVVLDFETTGLNILNDRIIEIGAVRLENGSITESFSQLVNPDRALSREVSQLTGIDDSMLKGMPSPAEATAKLLEFIGDSAIAAHNASFDYGILQSELKRMNVKFSCPVVDTLILARSLYPELKSFRLGSLCKHLGVSLKNAHRAVHDAGATAQCLGIMLKTVASDDKNTLFEINEHLKRSSYGRSRNIDVLVQKQKGLENLYYLVSQGHIKYFSRNMRVPRFEISDHREGLLLGSGTPEGELYQALFVGTDDSKLEEIASFYDYLEIVPPEHLQEYVRSGIMLNNEEAININKKIVLLGKKLNKLVVAVGHVHFKNPEDSIYRAMIFATIGKKDFDKQAPMYYRTTEDMLDAHSYLGKELAYEVVVENTNKISDSIDNIRQYPVHPDGEKAVTFQPFWPDAKDNISNDTYKRARELYGDDLPPIVQARIDKELNSILGYGFATLYNIAQKLVKKSNSDGYLVGSRGSVGSSFVATMCGITEVNPLPAHYRCAKCKHTEFDVPKEYMVGIDLPDKDCPICHKPMIKDGYNIPFEVFLGFKGDKVPDIDLNFSGEYQSKAHAYVEELFGKGYVFRAGTISSLQEKNCYGYVNKYLELKGMHTNRAYKDRLVAGLVGVKKTTGQHPGGMVVLPKEYSIYNFTPIQKPANDMSSDSITTHFDFSSMHDILVKLDILGHDDPTMLHDLELVTNTLCKEIPINDKKVLSLFYSTEALGVSPKDILCETGTLGIPEFGTDFVQGMLLETKPHTMSELLRISGLSHGTDVWLGNAQTLIANGTATLNECVCTRDDIMESLLRYGMPEKLSFDTMEAVRKGRGLTPSTEEEMRNHNVPEWFIDSCKKIKYMFPKAHACAYVISALRIAYYKVYYPLAYYCTYLSIRGKAYDSSSMMLDTHILREKVKDMLDRRNDLSDLQKADLYVMRIALEMQSRGYKFLPADIYKSAATKFIIEDGAIRVPLSALKGLGEIAPNNIVEARSERFNSVDDLKKRAKIGDKVIEILKENNAIGDLPDKAQMDMFSMLGI